MKRTTIYLDPALEVRLKMEGLRRKQPMAELVREAVESYLAGGEATGPPGSGAFASGRTDTAERVDWALAETRFGAEAGTDQPAAKRTAAKRAPAKRARKRGA